MPASVLYMAMSLDGYIAGPNYEPGNPGGDGFDRFGGMMHGWPGVHGDDLTALAVESVQHHSIP